MQQTMRNHLNDTLPGFRIPGTRPVGKLQSMAKLRSRKIAGRETDSLQHIGRRRSDAGTRGKHIRAYQRGRLAQGVSKGFWRNGRFLQRRLKDAFIGGGNPQFRSGNNSIPEPMRGID